VKTNREIALEHAINTAHLSGTKTVVENATEYLAFLEGETVAEVEPIEYQYYRKVRSLSGRPLNDGDTYRVPSGLALGSGQRAEYLNDWDGYKTWVTCHSTTVKDVFDGYGRSTHDRIEKP
jgi:hypothetical protein